MNVSGSSADYEVHVQSPVPLERCSIAHTLDLIGDRWTLLILREAFYGVRRFEYVQHDLDIPRAVLTKRLAEMVEHGLLTRQPYQEENQRTRYEYRLTRKGADLLPVLVALMQWGDKYAIGEREPTMQLSHAECGAPVALTFVCGESHRIDDTRDLVANVQLDSDPDHGLNTARSVNAT